MTKKTITVLGMDLPVIAELEDPYVLALHPNGPCIATESTMWVLDFESSLEDELDDSGFVAIESPDPPIHVRHQAVSAYVAASWPIVKTRIVGMGLPVWRFMIPNPANPDSVRHTEVSDSE